MSRFAMIRPPRNVFLDDAEVSTLPWLQSVIDKLKASALGVFRRRPDGRIDAPDLFLHGMGLRRKGGVSRKK